MSAEPSLSCPERMCRIVKSYFLDDIYQAGFTLNEVGKVLFEAGAQSVFGLAATKTGRDL